MKLKKCNIVVYCRVTFHFYFHKAMWTISSGLIMNSALKGLLSGLLKLINVWKFVTLPHGLLENYLSKN